MKKSIFLLLCLVAMASCTDRKDLYDPNANTNTDPKDNPLEVEVPNNMDYSMITAVTVRVDVDDEYLGKYYYLVEVYDNDPLFSESPNLKAAGVAKQGEPFIKNIDIATAQKYLFIKRTDPRGRSVVGCMEVTAGATSLSYDFNPSAKRSVDSRAAGARAVELPTYTEVPAGAIEVKGASTNDDWFEEGKNYCITGNYSGGIYHSGNGGCKLFVSGTWNVPSSRNGNWDGESIEQGLEVIILPGGKIRSDGNLFFKVSSNLIIMKDATFQCSNLTFTNNGYIYNLGKLNVDNEILLQSQSSMYNNCMVQSKSFIANSSIEIFLNNGSILAQTIEFTSTVTINMEDGSMVKATESIYNDGTKYIARAGDKQSLVSASDITCNNGVYYIGKNLMVEAVKHTPGSPSGWSPFYLQENAKMSNTSVTLIETCGGGNTTPDPGHDPSDPTFPSDVVLSDTYIYAMEDQWPSYGDYDMNDVVVRVNKRIITQIGNGNNAKDYATALELDVDLLAVGASKQIAAGIQLDGIKMNTINADKGERVIHDGQKNGMIDGFTLENANNDHSEKGTGQDDIILPLFTSANKLLGGNYVNVGKGASTSTYPNMKIKVSFVNKKVSVNDLNYAKINFFITTDGVGENRTEIHLPGYMATRRANMSLSGEGVDNGERVYVSKDNLSWGLLVPDGSWQWPDEGVSIKTIYPTFVNWVTSGGKTHQDWYGK